MIIALLSSILFVADYSEGKTGMDAEHVATTKEDVEGAVSLFQSVLGTSSSG